MNCENFGNRSTPDLKSTDHARSLPDDMSTGSDKPGFVLFDRTGEPLMGNPYDKRDLETGPLHTIFFGTTRGGKCFSTSAVLKSLQDENQ